MQHAKVMNGDIVISDQSNNGNSGLRFTLSIPVESEAS